MRRLRNILAALWSRCLRLPEDGFSILTVVLSLALLASIVVGFTGVVRNRTARISNEVQAAHGRLLAEAGVEIAVARLLHSLSLPEDAPGRLIANATPVYCRMNEARLAISIQDAAGQVDLNTASNEMLSAFATAIAGREASADIVAAISARRAVTPFQLVEELAFVPGVTAGFYRALRPHVTLYSGYTGLAQRLAAEPLRGRLAAMSVNLTALLASLPTNRVFAVNVAVRGLGQAGYRLDAVVQISTVGRQLYRPLAWRGRVMRGRSDSGDPYDWMGLPSGALEMALPDCIVASS